MEWEDLFDEYGYGNDPDGVLVVTNIFDAGGFSDNHDDELLGFGEDASDA